MELTIDRPAPEALPGGFAPPPKELLMSIIPTGTATPLLLDDVGLTYDGRWVLDGVSLTAPPGSRLGIVGENGSGKSTLLRIAAGVQRPSRGSVSRPADTGYVAQDSGLEPRLTVAEVLREALAPAHEAVAELEALGARLTEPGAVDRYDEVLYWATRHDAWGATQRAERAAARLGLESVPPERRIAELSGGQRGRLALAALLARRPDCVLLDEPTNHLDDGALMFLEEELRSMPGVVVAASHDRVFLDTVCTTILDLDRTHFGTDGDGGRTYSGNYTAYLDEKARARARWQEAFEAQQEELNELRAASRTTNLDVAHNRSARDNDKFIHAFKGSRVQATVSRRRRNAEQRIEDLERHRISKPPRQLSFRGSFEASRAAGLSVRDAAVRGRFRLDRLDVAPGEHWLITGANGSGKSSLLAAIAGDLPLDEGVVDVGARGIGWLRQHVSFADPDRSPLELYAETGSEVPLVELGMMLPRDLHRPVGELSLGTQQRLALAMIMARRPDLVLLDEPTNHLSLGLVEELEQALTDSPATVLVASHDRWLRSRWVGPTVHLG